MTLNEAQKALDAVKEIIGENYVSSFMRLYRFFEDDFVLGKIILKKIQRQQIKLAKLVLTSEYQSFDFM